MTGFPRLVDCGPNPGADITIDRTPFSIGSSATCALQLFLPGVSERAASISEREDGFYLSSHPGGSRVTVDGRSVVTPIRLIDTAVLGFAAGALYEFTTGETRAVAVAPPSEFPQRSPLIDPDRPQRRRIRGRTSPGFPAWATLAIVLLVAVAAAGGYLAYESLMRERAVDHAVPPLTQFEGQLYDSLMLESTRSIERGSALLQAGIPDAALAEFARALTNFETSPLRTNPWVRPRIDALSNSIVLIYQSYRFKIPNGFNRKAGAVSDLSSSLSPRLTVNEFAAAFASARRGYENHFHEDFRVTGTDHQEHLSLYGPGGAIDIGVRGLSSSEIAYVVSAMQQAGIRVKDFSQDAVLAAEIKAAIASGKLDQAGTALHIHLDRFSDHNDRWTTR